METDLKALFEVGEVHGCTQTVCISQSFSVYVFRAIVKQAFISSFFFFFFPVLCSDGAHDGDDVSGRSGGVRPQCPADLWRVR